MQAIGIKTIKSIGIKPTIDLEVNHPDHNFYAEGLVTSNSHAVSYAVLSAQTIFLKFNHPTQFYLSLLKMTKHEPDPIGEISKINKEMLALGVELMPPSLTKSEIDFSIVGKNIRFGLSSIKGISFCLYRPTNGNPAISSATIDPIVISNILTDFFNFCESLLSCANCSAAR